MQELAVMYIVMATVWLVAGVSIATAYGGASGRLGRNGAVGFRTPGTLASDAGWRAGHRAAIPVIWLTVPASAASSVVMMAMGPRHNFCWAPMPVVAVLIAAAVVANKAARRAERV